jgi:hypothetical protein
MCAVAVLMLEVSVWHGILMHLASARVLARALGRNGLGRVHVSRRSGRGSGASVSWRVLHETKNRFLESLDESTTNLWLVHKLEMIEK